MGWFDKRNWRLRRKIKDLQDEMREAEEQGKFIVEQGIFFAELEDMGEMTMMAFGTDLLSSGEESVIRSFFDRNGFGVDTLKLDKTSTGLEEVEIIPPEEMTRAVARGLKNDGFKLVDDSEREMAPNLQAKIMTLSALMRSMTILFVEQIEGIVVNTRVKMNKEGNRLLHWLPKIVEVLEAKVDQFTVAAVRPSFNDAYEQFYGQLGKAAAKTPGSAPKADAPPPGGAERIPAVKFPMKVPGKEEVQMPQSMMPSSPVPLPPTADKLVMPPKKPAAAAPAAPTPVPPKSAIPELEKRPIVTAPPSKAIVESEDLKKLERSRDAAEALARMYKVLVKANPSRCVRNCEMLLEEINRVFESSATCVLVKVPQGHGVTVHAQGGKKLSWGEGGGEGYPISSTIVTDCIKKQKVVSSITGGGGTSESMVLHKIDCAMAAPITADNEVVGIVYVDRRDGKTMFTEADCATLELLVQAFEDYPDLTLGLVV